MSEQRPEMLDALRLYGTKLGNATYWLVYFSTLYLLLYGFEALGYTPTDHVVLAAYILVLALLLVPFPYILIGGTGGTLQQAQLVSLGAQVALVGAGIGVVLVLAPPSVGVIEAVLVGTMLLAGSCLGLAGSNRSIGSLGWRELTALGYAVLGVGLAVVWLATVSQMTGGIRVVAILFAAYSAGNCVVAIEIARESGRFPIEPTATPDRPVSPIDPQVDLPG